MSITARYGWAGCDGIYGEVDDGEDVTCVMVMLFAHPDRPPEGVAWTRPWGSYWGEHGPTANKAVIAAELAAIDVLLRERGRYDR